MTATIYTRLGDEGLWYDVFIDDYSDVHIFATDFIWSAQSDNVRFTLSCSSSSCKSSPMPGAGYEFASILVAQKDPVQLLIGATAIDINGVNSEVRQWP